MIAFLYAILQSLVLTAALLEQPSGKLAIRGGALVITDAGKDCCCGTPNCHCCEKEITGVLLEFAGIGNSPTLSGGGGDARCEGCDSLNKTVLVPWESDCGGFVNYADADAVDPVSPVGFDVDCFFDPFGASPEVPAPYWDEYTIEIVWSITCDLDFDTGLTTLTLDVTYRMYQPLAGAVDIATFQKVVPDLDIDEAKKCKTYLDGSVPRTFTIGEMPGGCDFSGITCTATLQEAG